MFEKLFKKVCEKPLKIVGKSCVKNWIWKGLKVGSKKGLKKKKKQKETQTYLTPFSPRSPAHLPSFFFFPAAHLHPAGPPTPLSPSLSGCHTRFSEENQMHLICAPGSSLHTYDGRHEWNINKQQ
jgi:hypothetical protein